jgi:glycosyltransferase involved in cell wall biosynthesis
VSRRTRDPADVASGRLSFSQDGGARGGAASRRARSPIRVCFPFVGDLLGGSHISALGLVRHLDRSRFAPLVVLQRDDGPLADLLRREGVPFETAETRAHLRNAAPHDWRAAAYLARALPPLVRYLRARRVDIVHTNDGRTHLGWGLAARLAGARLLWHQRGDPGSFGLRWIAPWAAHRIVAVSSFAAPPAGLFSGARKCRVVHSPFDTRRSGIDRAASRRRLAAELKVAPDARLLGYVGTLVGRKRPLLFVEAVAALSRQAPALPVHGLLFGDALFGLDEAVRARAAALGVADRIHLMGFRYPGEPWLAALDLLLVTAVDEPFGRTLIEAMLLGTPVIAARSGGNIEAIRDGATGILVPPDDPEAFATAALELLGDRGRYRRLATDAEREARDRFGIDRHVDAITRIYDEMLQC